MASFVPPKDRVLEHSSDAGPGLGPYTLNGAVDASFDAFSASMSDGDWTIGGIVEPGVAFASGIITFHNTSGVMTATITTSFETKGTFSTGTKEIFMGLPSQGNGWTTGDAKLTFKTVADAGWILCDDGSIGDGSSNATTLANGAAVYLFMLLYNNVAALVIQDSSGSTQSRGASAAADFAAHRRLVIPKTLGRSIAIAGAGSGLTSRTLGGTAGSETETPTISKTAAHNHGVNNYTQNFGLASGANTSAGTLANTVSDTTGSGTALNILDPSTYMNIMIKL